ncbi:PAS domain-containing protein [Acetobacteraceae bacterium H6797]|nr:PAS domain-containing protein [Acetobacteraceae bacterium H6797]
MSVPKEEAQRLQSALAESEAKLRRVQRIGMVGGFEIDLRSGLNYRSAEYMAVQGLAASPAEESHAHWVARLHPEDRERAESYFFAAIAPNGPSEYVQEYRIITHKGETRWVSARAEIERDEAGIATRMIGAHLDVTALRSVQAELERVNHALEDRVREEVAKREAAQARAAHAERLRALGQLASGIAHDMNNVLQTVIGVAEVISLSAENPAQVLSMADALRRTAERGAAVTSRLLSFARPELEVEVIHPVELLERLTEVLQHTLGREYRCHILPVPPDAPAMLADWRQLETALINLAINARDAMPKGGRITFSAAAEQVEGPHPAKLAPGLYLRLEVRDEGVGMDEEMLAEVTQPFFTTKPAGQGTGLGLSTAKGFAEQSGGALALESRLGEGTVVKLWMPAAA